MPVRFLSDAQREQLSGFPSELDSEVLGRFFTLSGADLAEARQRRGDGNRLGWSLQLCGLRMLGFCPDDVTTAPVEAVALQHPTTRSAWASELVHPHRPSPPTADQRPTQRSTVPRRVLK